MVRGDTVDSTPSALVARSAQIELPSDHVRVLHREARTGAVAVVHRPGGRWIERAISLRNLPRYVDSLPAGLDCYGSQGRFAGRRKVASLITIDSIWLDLDYHKTVRYAQSEPETVLWSLLGRCETEDLPAPSYVFATGRGLCAVWLHDVLPRAALGRWQAVQAGLHERFSGFGVDGCARDAARVLRLVGTTNTKVDRPVRCLFPSVGEPERYSFEELAAALLPYADPRDADRERALPAQRPLSGLRLAASEGRSTSSGPWLLWGRRLDDLQELRRIRWFGPLPPGHRDPWMFLTSVALSWMVPSHVVKREILAFGSEALGGAWTRQALLRDMGAVVRRAEAAARGEFVEWPPGSGERQDPRYRSRDQTIIDVLDITDEELAALPASGQLGRAGLAVRQAERGKRGGVASGESRRSRAAERDAEIEGIRREEGLSQRAIAARVGVSRDLVRWVLSRDLGGGG